MDTTTKRTPGNHIVLAFAPMKAATYGAMLASRRLANLFDNTSITGSMLLHAIYVSVLLEMSLIAFGQSISSLKLSAGLSTTLTVRAGSMSSNAVAPFKRGKYEKDWPSISRISGGVTQGCIQVEIEVSSLEGRRLIMCNAPIGRGGSPKSSPNPWPGCEKSLSRKRQNSNPSHRNSPCPSS